MDKAYLSRVRGVAVRGVAVRGVAVRGVAVRGVAVRGVAVRGLAGRGLAGRGLAVAALVLSALTMLSAQQPSQAQPAQQPTQPQPQQATQAQTGQTPTFRSGVELVTIDVGVVDWQGQPMRGLTAADFMVGVAGQPRRVVSAEFVDSLAETSRSNLRRSSLESMISSNEGASIGRMFVFVVDQGTLEPGNVRHVGQAASRFLSTLSFADRSALMLLPSGPNVTFTWAHDKVREALGRVIGQSGHDNAFEFGSLTEAREISNRSLVALRTVAQRECGTGAAASTGLDGFSGGSGGLGGQSVPSRRRRRRWHARRWRGRRRRNGRRRRRAAAAPRDRRVARARDSARAAGAGAGASAAAAPATCRCAPSGRGVEYR